jgi:Haemolymph juvenile hormone binding protein (JHBP)
MANEIIAQGKTGYPALGLAVFDPLRIDKMTIHQKEGPVNLKIDFNNFNLRGMSDIKFSKVEGFQKDFEKAKIELRFQFPVIELTGPYTLEGKVLVLPVSGNGNCNMSIC